ncbi:hypothetical protein DUNSADRAFT_14795, partial [Dunaliella salina]
RVDAELRKSGNGRGTHAHAQPSSPSAQQRPCWSHTLPPPQQPQQLPCRYPLPPHLDSQLHLSLPLPPSSGQPSFPVMLNPLGSPCPLLLPILAPKRSTTHPHPEPPRPPSPPVDYLATFSPVPDSPTDSYAHNNPGCTGQLPPSPTFATASTCLKQECRPPSPTFAPSAPSRPSHGHSLPLPAFAALTDVNVPEKQPACQNTLPAPPQTAAGMQTQTTAAAAAQGAIDEHPLPSFSQTLFPCPSSSPTQHANHHPSSASISCMPSPPPQPSESLAPTTPTTHNQHAAQTSHTPSTPPQVVSPHQYQPLATPPSAASAPTLHPLPLSQQHPFSPQVLPAPSGPFPRPPPPQQQTLFAQPNQTPSQSLPPDLGGNLPRNVNTHCKDACSQFCGDAAVLKCLTDNMAPFHEHQQTLAPIPPSQIAGQSLLLAHPLQWHPSTYSDPPQQSLQLLRGQQAHTPYMTACGGTSEPNSNRSGSCGTIHHAAVSQGDGQLLASLSQPHPNPSPAATPNIQSFVQCSPALGPQQSLFGYQPQQSLSHGISNSNFAAPPQASLWDMQHH